VDPAFKPHGRWDRLPARRRDEMAVETPPAHGVTSQGVTWEIVGADPEPEPPALAAAPEAPAPEAPAKSPPPAALAENKPVREIASGNGSMVLAETKSEPASPPERAEPEGPTRRGWWNRRFGGD
jgi:hypothetical protein